MRDQIIKLSWSILLNPEITENVIIYYIPKKLYNKFNIFYHGRFDEGNFPKVILVLLKYLIQLYHHEIKIN